MDSLRNINDSSPLRVGLIARVGCVLILLATLAAPGAVAQPSDHLQGGTKDASSSYFGTSTPGVGIKRATAIARKHTGGRVLSASPRQTGQATHYRVRVLVDGERVVTVTVNQDGEIIRPD